MKILIMVIKEVANVNAADKDGGTPLHGAANNGHKEVANVNAADKDGGTPLHGAANNGHKEVANVNAADKDGGTLLHEDTNNGHKEVAKPDHEKPQRNKDACIAVGCVLMSVALASLASILVLSPVVIIALCVCVVTSLIPAGIYGYKGYQYQQDSNTISDDIKTKFGNMSAKNTSVSQVHNF